MCRLILRFVLIPPSVACCRAEQPSPADPTKHVVTILFSVIVPIGYHLAFDEFPFDGLKGIAILVGVGAVAGAVLGALFPRVFGFIFEMFLDT